MNNNVELILNALKEHPNGISSKLLIQELETHPEFGGKSAGITVGKMKSSQNPDLFYDEETDMFFHRKYLQNKRNQVQNPNTAVSSNSGSASEISVQDRNLIINPHWQKDPGMAAQRPTGSQSEHLGGILDGVFYDLWSNPNVTVTRIVLVSKTQRTTLNIAKGSRIQVTFGRVQMATFEIDCVTLMAIFVAGEKEPYCYEPTTPVYISVRIIGT